MYQAPLTSVKLLMKNLYALKLISKFKRKRVKFSSTYSN